MSALQSKLFRDDLRLQDCAVKDAAHVTPGSVGAFVGKIQTALVALRDAAIDAGEIAAARYGGSTAAAVLKYKETHVPPIINPTYQSRADNIVGKMTIGFLDREMLELERRPSPPTPVKPAALTFEEAPAKIKAYLAREARRNVAETLLARQENMVVLGETHFVADSMKAFLFFEMIRRTRGLRPVQTHFHASERFLNDSANRRMISDVLQASPPQAMAGPIARLNDDLRRFVPTLSAANGFPGRRYGILPSNSTAGHGIDDVAQREDARHAALFDAFVAACAQCPDVPALSINSSVSHGNFLLGARHAARRGIGGRTTETTCQRLIKAGWKVHAVRLVGPSHDPGTVVQEDLALKLLDSADERVLHALPIVEEVGGGRSFWADLTKPDSPFAQLKDRDSRGVEIPYTSLFDAIVFLGVLASL